MATNNSIQGQINYTNSLATNSNMSSSTSQPSTSQFNASSSTLKSNAVQQNANPTSAQSATQSLTQQLLSKSELLELVKEVDPNVQLDEDVEEILIHMVDSFVDTIASGSCKMAKHRNSSSIDVKDVQLYLEQAYHLWIPGLGTDELKPYKRPGITDAHKQRLLLKKKK